MPLCPPQISCRLAWDRTQVSNVKGQQLTTSAMEWLWEWLTLTKVYITFSSYLTQNTSHVHYKQQAIIFAYKDNQCLFWESCKTLAGKMQSFLLLLLGFEWLNEGSTLLRTVMNRTTSFILNILSILCYFLPTTMFLTRYFCYVL
jgi:hypothetical protein